MSPMTPARRARWPWVIFVTVVAVMLVAAASFVVVKITARLPIATVRIEVPASALPAGSRAPVPIPIPSQGSFALSASTPGESASHAAGVVRPIGSVAKAMTALVVLHSLPLAPGANGPSRTMTAADVALYRQAVAEGGSNLRVQAGEVLSERDLLLALLLPSADNIAETLAVWAAGNRTAFIANLNATAAAMGMHSTHFADPSGISSKTVSTASDLVLLAKAVIADPTLANLVSVQEVRLPDGIVLHNLDILLGKNSTWLGIKTGWTGAAGGCLLFAARKSFGTPPNVSLTVWGAVLGQPPGRASDPAHPELGEAFAAAESASSAVLSSYSAVDLDAAMPAVTGTIITAWGDRTQVQSLANAGSDVMLVRTGSVLRFSITKQVPSVPFERSTVVGHVTGVLNASTSVTWRVVATTGINGPDWTWKLFH
jgi:serine-type D-Ala-D-Ala carboxypeptidase (penicillin-binding protein 5/6)